MEVEEHASEPAPAAVQQQQQQQQQQQVAETEHLQSEQRQQRSRSPSPPPVQAQQSFMERAFSLAASARDGAWVGMQQAAAAMHWGIEELLVPSDSTGHAPDTGAEPTGGAAGELQQQELQQLASSGSFSSTASSPEPEPALQAAAAAASSDLSNADSLGSSDQDPEPVRRTSATPVATGAYAAAPVAAAAAAASVATQAAAAVPAHAAAKGPRVVCIVRHAARLDVLLDGAAAAAGPSRAAAAAAAAAAADAARAAAAAAADRGDAAATDAAAAAAGAADAKIGAAANGAAALATGDDGSAGSITAGAAGDGADADAIAGAAPAAVPVDDGPVQSADPAADAGGVSPPLSAAAQESTVAAVAAPATDRTEPPAAVDVATEKGDRGKEEELEGEEGGEEDEQQRLLQRRLREWSDRAARPYDTPIVDDGRAARAALAVLDSGALEGAWYSGASDATVWEMAAAGAPIGLCIVSSPFRRCLQTAGHVARVFGCGVVHVHLGVGERMDKVRQECGPGTLLVDPAEEAQRTDASVADAPPPPAASSLRRVVFAYLTPEEMGDALGEGVALGTILGERPPLTESAMQAKLRYSHVLARMCRGKELPAVVNGGGSGSGGGGSGGGGSGGGGGTRRASGNAGSGSSSGSGRRASSNGDSVTAAAAAAAASGAPPQHPPPRAAGASAAAAAAKARAGISHVVVVAHGDTLGAAAESLAGHLLYEADYCAWLAVAVGQRGGVGGGALGGVAACAGVQMMPLLDDDVL